MDVNQNPLTQDARKLTIMLKSLEMGIHWRPIICCHFLPNLFKAFYPLHRNMLMCLIENFSIRFEEKVLTREKQEQQMISFNNIHIKNQFLQLIQFVGRLYAICNQSEQRHAMMVPGLGITK